MELEQMLDIIINCLGYSFEQAYTSNIDILGVYAATGDEDLARVSNLKLISDVYNQLSCLTHETPHWGISRKQIEECKRLEV